MEFIIRTEEQRDAWLRQHQLNVRLFENAKNGNHDQVRHLLQWGANVNYKDVHDDDSDAESNLLSRNRGLAWDLLRLNNNVNLNEYHSLGNNTSLLEACLWGHVEVVRELLLCENINVNATNDHGCTALITAILHGKSEVVPFLLEHTNIDVDARDDNGRTALILASVDGHLEVVHELLLRDEVDANAVDMKGCTAFALASYRGHWDVVREFLKHDKVDVNVQGSHGNTALIWATLGNHVDVVRNLLENEKWV
ncbi:hypothetical protein MHU86_1393 [Fragilaria crotonensis]|nr:hypothetical protein MHU86_1393 [Fragilaria crotonensis]